MKVLGVSEEKLYALEGFVPPTHYAVWVGEPDYSEANGRRLLLERGEKEGFAWRSLPECGRVDMLLNLSSGDLVLTRALLKSGLKVGGKRRGADYRGMNTIFYKKI